MQLSFGQLCRHQVEINELFNAASKANSKDRPQALKAARKFLQTHSKVEYGMKVDSYGCVTHDRVTLFEKSLVGLGSCCSSCSATKGLGKVKTP